MFEGWDASSSFVLRPPADSAGAGVARIHTPGDLLLYAGALAAAQPRLPPGTLTGQEEAVTMPATPPSVLVAEPWVDTDPVALPADAAAAPSSSGSAPALQWSWEGSSSRWLEVTIGLVGELVSVQEALGRAARSAACHHLTASKRMRVRASTAEGRRLVPTTASSAHVSD
jgi:hypothetical protein